MVEEVKNNETSTVIESKTKSSWLKIEDRFLRWNLMLEGLEKSPESMAAMAQRSYTPERIVGIKSALNELSLLHKVQKKEQGEQHDATDRFQLLKSELEEIYTDLRELGQVAFKNDEIRKKSLGLDGAKKRTLSGLSEQLGQFLTNALNDQHALDELAKLGISTEELNSWNSKLKETITAKVAAEKEKAEAVKATDERDKKLEEVEEMMRDLKAVAQVALRKRADLLKKMGL